MSIIIIPLTPSLPRPVKFPGWKLHIYTPADSIFDGSTTHLLSVLCILIESFHAFMRSGEREKKRRSNNDFHFGQFVSFSEWRRGRHGSGRVKDTSVLLVWSRLCSNPKHQLGPFLHPLPNVWKVASTPKPISLRIKLCSVAGTSLRQLCSSHCHNYPTAGIYL